MPSSAESRNAAITALANASGVECKLAQVNTDSVHEVDEWNPEREKLAQELLAKDTSEIAPFWQEKYEREANLNWHKFYKRNSTNFYKDRHYLHHVFPELATSSSSTKRHLLEVGCGVGNAVLPLLEINSSLHIRAFDFAESAVSFLQEQPLFDSARVTVGCADATSIESIHNAIGTGLNDFALCMFCLSAIHPSKMADAMSNIASLLTPGGLLFFRDYGRYDQAQLRFKPGHKLADNFYVRQDLTRAYYFTLEEIRDLANQAGLKVIELEYIRRQYINRKTQSTRFRVWIHGKFQKS